MRFIISSLLFLVFTLPALADMQERRFEPTQKFTLKIDKVQVEVPYAYIREYWLVKLEKDKIINVQEDNQGAVFFQYLFPSLAPPPANCEPNKRHCAGEAVKGFPPAPKGKDQVYVNYIVSKLSEKIPSDYDIARFLRGPTANHVLYGDKFTENKKLGLIESKPFLDFERYVPIEKLKYVTLISCLKKVCFFEEYDKLNNLTHDVTIDKNHLPKWKEILASRQIIFERYLKK